MIGFRVKRPDTITGGLTFQLVYDKTDDKNQNDVTNFDYTDSIVVQEDAFNLIEPIFYNNESTERTAEQQQYYHWGLNYHDKKALKIILQEMEVLRDDIEKYETPYAKQDLEFYISKKLSKILNIRRIRYKYQDKMIHFLEEMIDFIAVAIKDGEVKGVWVSGI